MTTDTLEAYEAVDEVEVQVSLAMLDEVAEHGRIEGRTEALADVEDTIVESLDHIEQVVEEIVGGSLREVEDLIHAVASDTEDTLRTVGSWVADLHLRLHSFEERITKALRREFEDEPSLGQVEIQALEAELDDVTQAEAEVATAVNALAKAMFFLAETPSVGREQEEEADENIEYAYWCLMKARSDVGSWAMEIQRQLGEARA